MIQVKIMKLLDVQSGVSQKDGNPWKSREVVIEAVQNAMYPDQFVARLFGDAVDKFTAQEGETLNVALHHRVREYNGKYYGEVRIVEFNQ